MTQEIMNNTFRTGLGQQFQVLFTTADDLVFVSYEKAVAYAQEKSLPSTDVTEWREAYSISKPVLITRT